MQMRALSGVALASGLRRHALASLVLQALAIAITLATGVVLARTLGPAEYGAWATSLGALAALATITTLGLPNLVTRRVAESGSRHEWNVAETVIGRSIRLSAASAVAFALLAAAVVCALDGVRSTYALLFAVAVAALPFMTLTTIWGAAVRGLGHGVAAQALPTLLRPVILLAGVFVAIFLFSAKVDAQLAMLINLVAAGVTLVATAVLYRRIRPPEFGKASTSAKVDGLWQEAAPFMILSLTAVVGARIDLFLIAALLDVSAAGLYEVAYRGADLVILPLAATTAVLAPEYAKRYALEDRRSLQRLVTQSCRGLLILSAPVAVCLVLMPGPIVWLVFGPEYARSAESMAILAAGYLVTLVMGPVHVLAGMIGHGRASATGAIAAAVLGASLSLLLIPKFGIQGAALSRAIGQVTTAIWLGWWIQRRTGIRTSAWGGFPLALANKAA